MKRLRFDATARSELRDAFRYYEERQTGLGKKLLTAVEGACQKVQENPRVGRAAPHGMRRCPVPNFPYHVVFENQTDCIFIFAVSHLRRRPEYWVNRLPDR